MEGEDTRGRRREKIDDIHLDSSAEQKRWRAKYKRMQRAVKQQVFINAALYDDIGSIEQQFIQAKAERKMLMKKLFQHLPMTESQVLQSTHALKALENNFPGKIPTSILSPVANTSKEHTLPFPQEKKAKKSSSSSTLPTKQPTTTTTTGKCSTKQPMKASVLPENKDGEKTDGGGTKPKRKKPGTAPKKVQSILMDNQGVPLFPIQLGTLTVHDLGQIVPDRPGFHSERYIWPVGFCSTRVYPSMVDPERRIQYFCYIKGGGAEPVFEIIPEDEPDNVITAVTATACHCVLLKRLNKARGKDATNTGSGPEFFGFSHPTIQYLIQCLPGAQACDKYVRTGFEIPGRNADTPPNVLHDHNLPIMQLHDRSLLHLPHPGDHAPDD